MRINFLLISVVMLGLYSCRNKTENIEYDANGKIEKRTVYISEDKSHYRELNYYPDEKLKGLSEFQDGILHGRSFSYYPNGNIRSVFYYEMGKLNSIGRYYNEEGKLTDKGLFINDSMVVKEEFFYKENLLKVNIFARNKENFGQAGSLLYNEKGLFGLDNSFYFIVSSLDSVPQSDSIKISVDFIGNKDKGAHIALSLGPLNENLQFLQKDKTYLSDSLSLSFYYKPGKQGYNLILGKLLYITAPPKESVEEFIFYHDFLTY